jgi:hypothetical protein
LDKNQRNVCALSELLLRSGGAKRIDNFIRWTVWARIAVIFYFVAFVLLVSAPRALLSVGLIDLLAAIWTWLALKKDNDFDNQN